MPLCIGKMTVNVGLCGAIPRSSKIRTSSPLSQDTRSAHALRENITTFEFNKNRGAHEEAVPTHQSSSPNSLKQCLVDRSKTPVLNGDNIIRKAQPPSSFSISQHTSSPSSSPPPPSLLLSKTVSQSEDSEDTDATVMPRLAPPPPRSQTIPVIDPPRWAVPAKGESRLEPVCEALGTHVTVDLTLKSCFRIGRSPTSDVQLMHGTSSRRHALLFHHPNGHCYVVDCGSAHGTFVNGIRVRSTPSEGMVAPHRVRRGALIRFGGPGAPSFVLKSFSVGFSYMVKDLESPSCHPTLSPSPTTTADLDGGRQQQVQVNTRINAFGNNVRCTTTTTTTGGGILKKRSFDDHDSSSSSGLAPAAKRRCVSPLSPTGASSDPMRLVSPEQGGAGQHRRVTFNDVPQAFYPSLISPDLSSEDDASL